MKVNVLDLRRKTDEMAYEEERQLKWMEDELMKKQMVYEGIYRKVLGLVLYL